LRKRLEGEGRRSGTESLHARLASVDPVAAARIHPHNVRRVIRALEVWEQTGRPISAWWSLDASRKGKYNTRQFGLTAPRTELYQRIEARVDAMLAVGLVEEVKGLLDQGYGEELTSMKGLGYAQVAAYLRGRISLEEAVRWLKRDTRRLAKRQLTWFRADRRVEWMDVSEYGGVEEIAAGIRERWHER
jgi:tRNA dimethylallyltransferase